MNLFENTEHYLSDKMCREKICCLIFVCYFASVYAMNLGSVSQNQCTIDEDCVSLTECNSYMSVIKSLKKPLKPLVVQFLREKQCGFEDGYPKLCCPNFPKDDDATKSTQNGYKTCKEHSKCIPLKNCQGYLEFINKVRKPLNSFVVQFLRSQQCGYQEDHPLVCCSPVPKGYEIIGQISTEVFKGRNKLSNVEQTSTEGLSTTESTTKVSKVIRNKKFNEKAEVLNTYFQIGDFFDLMDLFLFRRKK